MKDWMKTYLLIVLSGLAGLILGYWQGVPEAGGVIFALAATGALVVSALGKRDADRACEEKR